MSMTDPIADMLSRIRNAISTRKSQVDVPASTVKQNITAILLEEGFVEGFTTVDSTLTIRLKYDAEKQNAIQAIRRISKPGQRQYVRTTAIPKIRSGLGVAILSTSKGIMADRKAKALGLGGELLCEVW